jgi:hypothetical protein
MMATADLVLWKAEKNEDWFDIYNVNVLQHAKLGHIKECNTGTIHEILWRGSCNCKEGEEGGEEKAEIQ